MSDPEYSGILEHDVMVTPKFVAALAAAVLWSWCSAALAQSAQSQSAQSQSAQSQSAQSQSAESGSSQPMAPQSVDGVSPVACESAGDLYALLDAAGRDYASAQAGLSAPNCQALAGRHYEVVAEKNGIVTIRLFPSNGDRAGPRLAVTLDEMVDPDLFPGTDESPPPSS
jgi:hypothetical protein